MPTSRSYRDGCPIARALDVVGDRWALLVVRELLFGPQRFSDLRRALPGASTNMLTDRLRELESRGVLRRRVLPPPAGSTVYELSDRGRDLERVLVALGEWGASESPPPDGSLSPGAVLMFLRGLGRAHPDPPDGVWVVVLHGQPWTIICRGGTFEIEPGVLPGAESRLETDPTTLNALLLDPGGLGPAIAEGRVQLYGSDTAPPWLTVAI
ncbi:MAG TPA: helix-turn-helix domain-containing protein [Solirubrobacteraceae bacterium]|jgi:DNA-binding HxlR family transcriptional regulator